MPTTKKNTTKTTQKKAPATKKGKRKIDRASIIIIVCLLIILIPCGIYAWILISASMGTGTPVIADRFENDLDPAIESSQITQIENSIKGYGEVDKVNVELATATLRIYVDVTDGYSADECKAEAEKVYTEVASVLDINTYFTQHDNMKMYDLEIHVYNLGSDRDSDSFAYVIATKTSNMETANYQVVSEPIDANLAQQLRDDVENRNNPQPTPDEEGDITVGSGDTIQEGTENPEEAEPEATPE